jgi:hypothetical protein
MTLGTSNVLELLQLGLSGFAFLMVYLAFRLLKSEQQRDSIRNSMLRSAYVFMFVTFVFSLLVGASAIFELIRKTTVAADQQDIARCRDDLGRLGAIAELKDQDVADIQTAIRRFEASCESVLERLDVRASNGR